MKITAPIISLITSVILLTIGWMTVVRFSQPSIQAIWAHGLYQRKTFAADRIQEPKIVIIGGSGAHYGYSAREISRETGLPVVNFGSHAGLGLPYILYKARKVLKPNDFAVLA